MANRLEIETYDMIRHRDNLKSKAILIEDGYQQVLLNYVDSNITQSLDELMPYILKNKPDNWDIEGQLREYGCMCAGLWLDSDEISDVLNKLKKEGRI